MQGPSAHSAPRVDPSKRPWTFAGVVQFCARRKPVFGGIPTSSGVYLLEIDDRAYVGSAGDLRRRLNDYRNPTDSFDEHHRRDLIVQAARAAVFYITNEELSDKSKREALEQEILAEHRAAGTVTINRGEKRDEAYLQKKIAHYQAIVEKTKADLHSLAFVRKR